MTSEQDNELAALESVFYPNDVILELEGKELYVNRDELTKMSPVFKTMLQLHGDFKEKNAQNIKLSGKDYKTFVHFLRCSLPGIQDPFDEKLVHDVLPLIEEYQVDETRKRADKFLAGIIKQSNDWLSEQLVHSILEAEQYNLTEYLDECTKLASCKLLKNLEAVPKFLKISLAVRYRIAINRWENVDRCFKQHIGWRSDSLPCSNRPCMCDSWKKITSSDEVVETNPIFLVQNTPLI